MYPSEEDEFDIGPQDPIRIPDRVGIGQGRDPEAVVASAPDTAERVYPGEEEFDNVPMGPGHDKQQATEELLTPRAAQDPTQPMVAPHAEKSLPGAPPQAMAQPAPMAPPEKGGGFNWGRAFWSAGGGSLADFDAPGVRAREEPYKRAAFEQDQALKREQLNAYSLQKQKARDAIDPGSKDSLAAQEDFAALMGGRAAQLRDKHPALAAEFEAYAKKAPSMHAMAIERALKNPRMAEVLRQIDSESRNDLAAANLGVKREALGATIADKTEDNAMKRSELGLKRSELDLRRQERLDARGEKRADAEAKKGEKIPEGSQVEKYGQRKVAIGEIDKALNLIDQVRYTGKGAEFANSLSSELPDKGSAIDKVTGIHDPRNDAEREFVGLIKGLTAHERNKIFGGALSNFDIKDAKGFLAALGTNKETIKANLRRLRAAAADINATDKTLYPGLSKLDAAQPSSGAPSRLQLAKEALADPQASPADKAAAQRIIDKAGGK